MAPRPEAPGDADDAQTAPSGDGELVARLFPALSGLPVRALGEGWMNRALAVDGRIVLRFAKHADTAHDTRKEQALLPALSGALDVAIPQFTFQGEHPDTALPVVGYAMLPGAPLVERSSWGDLSELARDVAHLLDQLGAFPVERALALGVPARDVRAELTAERAALTAISLPADVARYVAGRFEAYLDEPRHFAFAPALVHADLSPDHLLVAGERPRLTGVIDWGDAAVGDPDCEYLYPLIDLGEEFVRQVLAARGLDRSPARMAKLSLLVTFDHVRSIVGGQKYGRPELVEDGVEGLTAEARSLSARA